MIRSVSVALLILAALSASAQQAPRKAWDIADEERIARRVDPASIRARAADAKDADSAYSVIDGKRNPELYLPWELYADAVQQYLAAPDEWAATQRARANDVLRIFTDPIEFWPRFEEASAPYATLIRRERIGLERASTAPANERAAMIQKLKAEQSPQCAARAETLAAVEKALGRETLYTFLYEVVAVTGRSITNGPEQAQQLRFVAGGCR
jgi:hypothetical protein